MPSFGEHVIVGLAHSELQPHEEQLLRHHSPVGIILFKHNIDLSLAQDAWCEKLGKLIAEAKLATGRERLLVSIDHEGGRVHRFPAPVTHFPAASCYSESAYQVGFFMGLELKALGFNLDFAPVLDVFSEPLNTVIGDRAFGSLPKEVGDCAVEMAKGLLDAGVIPCGKHFPGHGATIADSHFELPELASTKAEMTKRELIPFKIATESKLFPMMMTAHVRYPSLDAENPATFSRRIITELLREELGFSGVVVSDDLGMMAVAEYSLAERALNALNAGVDLLLVGNPKSGDPTAEMGQMIEGLNASIGNGTLTANLQESSRRISELCKTVSCSEIELERVGCDEHSKLCQSLRSS